MGEPVNTRRPTPPADQDEAEVYLTSSDVAAILGASTRSVDRWADAGLLRCDHRTPGGHRRFRRADVDTLTTSRTAATERTS